MLTKTTKVLNGLQSRQVLPPETVSELEESLRERDTVPEHPALSPSAAEAATKETSSSKPLSPSASKANGLVRPDKRQIEQRIEEDRERHKRLRESIWAVSPEGDQEFLKLWDDASDVGEDDFIAAHEDAEERRLATIEVD